MKGGLLVDFHVILTRWKNHFWRLFTLHAVKDLMKIEIYTAEQLVPEPSAFEDDDEIAVKRWWVINHHILTTRTNKLQSRIILENACYPLVQNPLSSSLLSINISIKIYRKTILPVVLYRCETSPFTIKNNIAWGFFYQFHVYRVPCTN